MSERHSVTFCSCEFGTSFAFILERFKVLASFRGLRWGRAVGAQRGVAGDSRRPPSPRIPCVLRCTAPSTRNDWAGTPGFLFCSRCSYHASGLKPPRERCHRRRLRQPHPRPFVLPASRWGEHASPGGRGPRPAGPYGRPALAAHASAERHCSEPCASPCLSPPVLSCTSPRDGTLPSSRSGPHGLEGPTLTSSAAEKRNDGDFPLQKFLGFCTLFSEFPFIMFSLPFISSK